MLSINKAIFNFCFYNNIFITVIYFCINIRFIIKMIICRILNGIIRYFRFYIINNKIDCSIFCALSITAHLRPLRFLSWNHTENPAVFSHLL